MEQAGELRRVEGARCEDEIGGIVDLYQRQMGLPALLFDGIPGYPKGYRVLANSLTSLKRVALTLGLPEGARERDVIQFWRDYLKESRLVPPRFVETGLVMQNVRSAPRVDLTQFPSPKWHEFDGGRFIGTGCMVIMRDPDTGWVNFGAYRVQVHGPDVASVMISKGKHGDIIMRRYHERGEPCPVAVVVGMHPLLFMVSGLEVPYGVGEYDVTGGLWGRPVPVVKAPQTGLPIPADAEIAFEGLIRPGDVIEEGPFGEWTGYYASGVRKQPVIRVSTLMYRDDPIILGAAPAVPPCDDTYYRGFFRSAAVWHQLEGAGIPGVKGVWAHEAGGGRFWLTVSIEQMYAGHAKQAGLVASQCHAGAYANRFVVVVDDDIDPANMNEVIWAMCTRVDPREDLEVLKGCWSTALDPMSYPDDSKVLNARVVIDACRPWTRRHTFPRVARSTREMDERILAKWPDLFPQAMRAGRVQ
jgi:4-hydroxy-3-polyprenylbenzoate decarboxylase